MGCTGRRISRKQGYPLLPGFRPFVKGWRIKAFLGRTGSNINFMLVVGVQETDYIFIDFNFCGVVDEVLRL